jgi:transposase
MSKSILLPNKEKIKYLYYKELKTQVEIAKIIGCHVDTIRYWMKKWKLKGRDSTSSNAITQAKRRGFIINEETVIDLYTKEFKSITEIKTSLKTSNMYIAKILKKHKIIINNTLDKILKKRI